MTVMLLLPPPRSPNLRGNAFEVLGVSPDACPQDVKTAYLYLASRYHPDINPDPAAKEVFVRINQAYAYVTDHRDLTELMLKCQMVKTKEEYAEGLQIFKRAKLFAGIDPIVAGGPATGEMGQRLQTLGIYLMFRCPSCRWQERCDHATRYDEIEDIHRDLMAKQVARASAAFGNALGTLMDMFLSKKGGQVRDGPGQKGKIHKEKRP